MLRLRNVFAFLVLIFAVQISAMASSSISRDPTFTTVIEADFMPVVGDVDTLLVASFGNRSDVVFIEVDKDLFEFDSKYVSPAAMVIGELGALTGDMLVYGICAVSIKIDHNSPLHPEWSGLSGCYIA